MPRADAQSARVGAAPQAGARPEPDAVRRRRVRRTAIILGAIAVAFYLSFIVLAVVKAELGDGHRVTAPPPAAAVR